MRQLFVAYGMLAITTALASHRAQQRPIGQALEFQNPQQFFASGRNRLSRETDAKFRVIDMNAEARKAWGQEYNKPETAYEFSNGRKFELRTEDAAIYATSPDFGS